MIYVDELDLGQPFDWHFANGVARGWGIVPGHDGPIRITIGTSTEVIVETETGHDRPELALAYDRIDLGFEVVIDFDLHILLREGIETFQVHAYLPSGQGVPVQLTPSVEAEIAHYRTLYARQVPRCYGRGFVIDNREEFGCGLPVLQAAAPRTGERGLVFVKLAAFGDFLWWNEERPDVIDGLRPLRRIGPRTAQAIAAGRLTLVLDMSNEGQSCERHFIDTLHNTLSQRGIPLAACVFISQNRRFAEDYHRDFGDAMHVLTHDYYIRRFAGLQAKHSNSLYQSQRIAAHIANRAIPRERVFLCMNFTPREHRIATLSYLFAHDLIDSGHVSFAGFDTVKMSIGSPQLPTGWDADGMLARGLERLSARGPMILDLDAADNTNVPEFVVGDDHFYDGSCFSLVTESEVAPPSLQRITEKVIKPLVMFHPVVIVGNWRSLALLRELGFRSFGPWIDERYDEIEDPAQRFGAAMAEVARLVALSPEERAKIYDALSPVLMHNYVVGTSLLDRWYRMAVEPELFARMASAADHTPQA